jgi:hypothetical protein
MLLRLLQGLLVVLLLLLLLPVLLCACKQRFMLLPIWMLRYPLLRLCLRSITLALLLWGINLKLLLLLLLVLQQGQTTEAQQHTVNYCPIQCVNGNNAVCGLPQ